MKKSIFVANKGFTLVELLVVIAIIAILATLGVTTFANATRRARDATRMSDINHIAQALVLYRSDNGQYPENLAALAVNGRYLREIPTPPNAFGTYNYVRTGANNRGFMICTRLEMPSGNHNSIGDAGGAITAPGDACNCTPTAAARPQRNLQNTGCCHCVLNP